MTLRLKRAKLSSFITYLQARQIPYKPGKDKFEVMRIYVNGAWGVVYDKLIRENELRFSRVLEPLLDDFKKEQLEHLKRTYPEWKGK